MLAFILLRSGRSLAFSWYMMHVAISHEIRRCLLTINKISRRFIMTENWWKIISAKNFGEINTRYYWIFKKRKSKFENRAWNYLFDKTCYKKYTINIFFFASTAGKAFPTIDYKPVPPADSCVHVMWRLRVCFWKYLVLPNCWVIKVFCELLSTYQL